MKPRTWHERLVGETETEKSKPAPKKPRKPKTYTVVCQQWEESERGWGTRPDGYSLHLTEAHREAYVKDSWEAERKRNTTGEVPDEYERPCGTPYLVDVTAKVYREIAEKTKNGARYYGPMPKGSKDGWVPA